MRPELAIDYAAWLRTLPSRSVGDVLGAFREDIAPACLDRYQRMCAGPVNVLEIPLKGFTYVYDFVSDPAAPLGIGDREDRALLAYGLSQKPERKRDAGRMRGFPGSDERGDRGHLVSHAARGGLDINVFHQDAYLNRGWSPAGKVYRSMERYCAENEGTFFFSRLLYDDDTARPSEIELGVLRRDGSLWVEVFDNRGL